MLNVKRLSAKLNHYVTQQEKVKKKKRRKEKKKKKFFKKKRKTENKSKRKKEKLIKTLMKINQIFGKWCIIMAKVRRISPHTLFSI